MKIKSFAVIAVLVVPIGLLTLSSSSVQARDRHIETPHVNTHIETPHVDKHIETPHVDKHIETPHVDSHIETPHVERAGRHR